MSDPAPPAGLERKLAALACALVAAALVITAFLAAGTALYNRLWPGSSSILIAVLLAFGASGCYAGWLLGLVVFAAVRDRTDQPGSR